MFCYFVKFVFFIYILCVKFKYMYFVIYFRNLVRCINCLLLVEGVVGIVLDFSLGEIGFYVFGKVDFFFVIFFGFSVI